MRKYTIILLTIILLSFNCFSQEYTPYTFQNFETGWTHHAYDENLFDEVLNAYLLEDIVITDNAIYSVYSISAVNFYFNGFLLEKLDAETGTLLWEYTYFQKSDTERDTPSQISLKDDNRLILSTFRELDEENQPFLWYDSQMNNWVFDSETGELLDTLTTINGDSNHIPMWMNVNPFYNQIVQSVVNEKNDSYRYLFSTTDSASVKILDYQLNELGHAIVSDSTFLPLKYLFLNQSFTTRWNENKFFNYRKSTSPNNPLDSFNIEITQLDSNLNILYSKNISNDFFGENHVLVQINESRFSVFHIGDYIFENEPYRHITLYVYDLEGNLLEEVALERPDGTPLYSTSGFNILPIEDLNQTLIISTANTENEAYWEWFLTTPNGNLERIGKTVLDNPYELFAWTFYNLSSFVKYLGNGKILLYTLHRPREESNNTTEAMIPSLSIISLDNLSTTVSIDIPTPLTKSIVYPNPTQSEINIKEKGKYKKYELYTVSGSLVSSETLQNDKIDLSSLSNGYYILKLYGGDNQVDVQKIVIQR